MWFILPEGETPVQGTPGEPPAAVEGQCPGREMQHP